MDIDDELLLTVKEIARQRKTTAGQVVSSLLRESLQPRDFKLEYRFWPDSVSILEANRFELAGAGPKSLTDLYLLRLATSFDGRLITFDRTIRWQWVAGCEADELEVL